MSDRDSPAGLEEDDARPASGQVPQVMSARGAGADAPALAPAREEQPSEVLLIEMARRELAERYAHRAAVLSEISLALDRDRPLRDSLDETCRILVGSEVQGCRIDLAWPEERLRIERGAGLAAGPEQAKDLLERVSIRIEGESAGELTCAVREEADRARVADLMSSVAQRIGLGAGRARARLREIEARERLQRVVDVVAHDLRNPLGVIQNSWQLLELPQLSAEDRSRALGAIERSVATATRIIDDLLLLQKSRASHVEMQWSEIDLHELLQLAADSCAPLAAERCVGIRSGRASSEEALRVRTDETHALRVVCNLVRNAVEVTPAGGRVDIRASCSEAGPALEIGDSGPGLPEDIARWLERSRTSEPPPERLRSGLGLAIIRDLSQHLHLRLRVDADAGTGTRIVVTFPAAGPGD